MSCCNDSNSNVCRQDIPYPQISHESVPSLISNLILALYGEITKSVVDGRVVWNIPCDPSDNPVTIDGFPRLPGEGLLCYIIRYFDDLAPILLDAVTISGAQTIAGQKTFNWIKLPVGTTGTRPTGQTGLIRFNTDLNQFEGYNNTTWSSIQTDAYTAGTGLTLSGNQFSVTTVPAGNGGTGQTAYSVGDILYASSSNALSKLADVATGSALISGGTNTAPSYGKIGLTTHVSGTLPVANGGTGDTLASGARTNLVAQKAFTFVDNTAPSSPSTNDIWIDTASLRQYTYTDSVWAEI